MDLQTRKIEFIQAFLKLQSEEVISQFEKLLKKESKIDSHFEPMSIIEFNERIEQSSEDSIPPKVGIPPPTSADS